MRVVFDIAVLGQGGMERQLVDLAGGLAARGHEPIVVANKSVHAYADEIARLGVRVVPLGRSARYDVRAVSDIVALSKRNRADVIAGVNFNATVWSRLAARRAGIAAVTIEHSTDRGRPRKIVLANRLLAAQTDAIVAAAEAQVESLVHEGNPRERITVVHHGVDSERFVYRPGAGAALRESLGVPRDAVVIALVAAHREEKRHDRFIALVEVLVARGLPVVGLAVGGGPLLEATKRRAKASPAASSLRIIGPVDDVAAAYSACDLSVICSDAVETLPLAVMEAQACEVPVVAMRVGGVAETFRPDETGILVEQGDIEGMATAVSQLVADADERRRMGAAGREWIRTHRSLDAMMEGYERVFVEAVDHHARRRRGRRGS